METWYMVQARRGSCEVVCEVACEVVCEVVCEVRGENEQRAKLGVIIGHPTRPSAWTETCDIFLRKLVVSMCVRTGASR